MKTVELSLRQYRANQVFGSVTTMKYTDKKQLVKLISYMATFDGGLYIVNRKDRPNSKNNAGFIMNMVKDNLDYVQWVASTLEQVTGVRIVDRPDYNTDGYNRKPQVRLESRKHPFLTKIRNRLYIDKTKVIDPHMLKLMDAEALAIIFMTDGGAFLDKGKYPEIKLHTKGFSYHDNMALSKAIYDKLNIRSTIQRHNKYYYLRIKTADVKLFVDTVLPYMCKSFLYKLERLAPVIKLDDDIVCSL